MRFLAVYTSSVRQADSARRVGGFYCRVIFTCVGAEKFTFAVKREAIFEGSHVKVKVEPHPTSRLSATLHTLIVTILFTRMKFTCAYKRLKITQQRKSTLTLGNQIIIITYAVAKRKD